VGQAFYRGGAITIQQLPVLTVTGTCGQTVYYDVDGRIIAFSCGHADTSGGPVGEKGEESHTTRDIFDSGGGGGTAMVVDTLDLLLREGRTDDHLLVIRADGELGNDANDYREVLDAHRQPRSVSAEPVQVDLGNRVQSFLDHDVDEHARPFIVICPLTVGSIGADQLVPTLRAAAEAHAPIRLLTL
jgi:hypothetical protein